MSRADDARTNEQQFTYAVRIIASHAMDNAPSGYLVAQVELIPGLLYVESERNPFTEGEWRWAMFVIGDKPNTTPLVSVLMTSDSGIMRQVREKLAVVSALFEGDFSGEWRERTQKRAADTQIELEQIQSELSGLAMYPDSEMQLLAGKTIRVIRVVQQLAKDLENLRERRR